MRYLRSNLAVSTIALCVGLLPSPAFTSDDFTAAEKAREYAQGLSLAFQRVASELEPSVVSIKSVRQVRPSGQFRRSPYSFGDEFFDRFFRFEGPQRPFEQRGIATGVIVREDGYILTNNHVIQGADTVEVTLHNGESYSARVMGADEKTDVAVLKIDETGLKPAKMGDSESIHVGEWVVAMGSPFGLAQTCTAGIISAKGRANVGIADYEDFIQTDAAINPGNSGGPLVDLDGNLLGINTAIVSRSGGFMGIGFAIPINMARSVMESLIDDGKVQRGWLGVAIQDLNSGLADSFGFDGTEGALIGDVSDDSPAEKAGLEIGDIIVSYNGQRATSMNHVRNFVAATKPGTTVTIGIVRDGKEKEVEVTIAELTAGTLAGGSALSEDLGLSVQNVSPEFSSKSGYDVAGGVVVTQVEPGSLAALAGLRTNDVIVSVGNSEVGNAGDFQALLKEADLARGIRLRVWTDGMRRFVFLKRR